MEGGRDVLYGEVRGDGSKRSGSREPDIAVSFATIAENLSDSGSLHRVHGPVTYTEKSFRIAVIEVKSPSKWQEDLTTK